MENHRCRVSFDAAGGHGRLRVLGPVGAYFARGLHPALHRRHADKPEIFTWHRAPVVITNVSVLLALYVVIVYLPGLEKVVQLLCLIPTTLNGIILATSVLGTYAGTNTLLANRIVMLSFIYCVFIMPMTYQGLRNSLYAVNTRGLLEAAEMLGARRFHSFLTIVVPAILPGLCNSALMCLSGLFGDFAIIKIIASSQFETAQSYLYRNRAQDTQELSAAVVILLLITLLINYLVHKSQDPADRVS